MVLILSFISGMLVPGSGNTYQNDIWSGDGRYHFFIKKYFRLSRIYRAARANFYVRLLFGIGIVAILEP